MFQEKDLGSGIVQAVEFDRRMSAAQVLEHLNEGKVVLGIGDPDKAIRENIPAAIPYYQNCSRVVLEPFVVMRSLTLHLFNGLANPRMMADDRLAENLDVILDSFTFDNSRRDRPHAFVEVLQSLPKNELAGNFLMRTHADYFKILVHYLNLNSLDSLTGFLERFRQARHSGQEQNATERVMELPAPFLEMVLATDSLASLDAFGKYLENHSVRKHRDFLEKVRFSNLKIVGECVVFEHIDELDEFFSNRQIKQNLLRSEAQKLLSFVQSLGMDEHSCRSLFIDIITRSFAERVEKGITKLDEVDALSKSDPSLKNYLRLSLRNTTFIDQDLVTVAGLAEAGMLCTPQSIILLSNAKEVLKEFLTAELAERYLTAPESRRNSVLQHMHEVRMDLLNQERRKSDQHIYTELHSTMRGGIEVVQALKD